MHYANRTQGPTTPSGRREEEQCSCSLPAHCSAFKEHRRPCCGKRPLHDVTRGSRLCSAFFVVGDVAREREGEGEKKRRCRSRTETKFCLHCFPPVRIHTHTCTHTHIDICIERGLASQPCMQQLLQLQLPSTPSAPKIRCSTFTFTFLSPSDKFKRKKR